MRYLKVEQAMPGAAAAEGTSTDYEMMVCSSCKVRSTSSELIPFHWSNDVRQGQGLAQRRSDSGKNCAVAGQSIAKNHAKVRPAHRRSKVALETVRVERFSGVCWRRSRVPARPVVEATASISPHPDRLEHQDTSPGFPDLRGARHRGPSIAPMRAPSILLQLCEQQVQLHQNLTYEYDRTPNSADKAAKLSQFFTADKVAAWLWLEFQKLYHPQKFVMIEPSAGKGAFLKQMPEGSLGIDLDPQYPGVVRADFLGVDRAWLAAHLALDRPIAILGNPPFGKGSELAWQFFNRAATMATLIGFILPVSVQKAAVENRLDQRFHLVAQWTVPENAFLFLGRPHKVRTVFQIWERRSDLRKLRHVEHSHPDFTFVKAEATAGKATVAIRRIGASAGRIYDDPAGKSASSHYFVQADPVVVQRLKALDLRQAAAKAVSIPSLAKSEIVEMYKAYLAQRDDDGLAA